tara:strand:+ start:253 stop:477 length:225 start_codon:yes stop_codon:yes gene_type:complete
MQTELQTAIKHVEQQLQLKGSLPDHRIYRIFKIHFSSETEAIKQAGIYIDQQEKLGNTETYSEPLFRKSDFIKN